MTVRLSFALAVLLALPAMLWAYPPAPHFTIHGLVRNEWGDPLTTQNAQIIFIPETGLRRSVSVIPGLRPGDNYEIHLPLDSFTAPDPYHPSVLPALVPFRIEVKIGDTTFLPLQMTGTFQIGAPAEDMRLDLTIGADSDGDGLPDSWKDLVIAMHGGGLTRADITPDGDLDGDGMTNYEEYIAGTYAWDPNDRIWLHITAVDALRNTFVEFQAINGRSYTLYVSTDLVEWRRVPFAIQGVDPSGVFRNEYFAPHLRRIHAHIPPPIEGDSSRRIYRLGVR